jgi:uncharacterized protein HemY
MSDKAKITLSVVLGIIGAILVFCLIVCIACSINGLTFGEQICNWFSANKEAVDTGKEIADAVSNMPKA